MEAAEPESGSIVIESDSEADPSINQWSPVRCTGLPPRSRSLHAGAVVGDSLYIFGGYDGTTRVNDFHRFCFKSSRWTQMMSSGASPTARDRHTVLSHDGWFYVFAGYDGINRVNDFWRFDCQGDCWGLVDVLSGQPPTPRHSHSGVENDGSIYVFAGYDGNYRNDIHQYDVSQRRWSAVPAKGHAPKARYRTSAVAYKGQMLVVGGHDGAKHLNDFHQFSFDTCEWTVVETCGQVPPPPPRDSHSATICGDTMYLFGGSTGSARNDLYSFNLEQGQWLEARVRTLSSGAATSSAQELSPCPRFCHTCDVYGGCMYVFGGYDGSQRLNDFWQLQLAPLAVCIDVPTGSLLLDLRSLVNEPRMSDVTFVVEGKLVYAHRLLCVRCPYFRNLFEGAPPAVDSTAPTSVPGLPSIAVAGVPHKVFLSLLEYLYTDEVEINLDIAMDLFAAADMFGVDRLKRLCERKIHSSINIDSAARILQAASRHMTLYLRQSCMDFILRNFDAVSKTQAFEEMGRSNVELVFEILKQR